MRASIIIPVHNAAEYLPRTLPSWLDQSYEGEYEVLAIDNNSTDESEQLLREADDPRLRVVHEPVQSAYAARNRGASEARGEALVFTDPDCAATQTWLTRMLACLEQPGVELVSGRDRPAGQGAGIQLLSAYDHQKEVFTFEHPDPAVYFGHTNNMAMSKALWNRLGPFDTRARGADVMFIQWVLKEFGVEAVVYHPEAEVEHLEVDSTKVYFRKCRLYGRSGRLYKQEVPTRPLMHKERWTIYRQTIGHEPLSWIEAIHLLLLLVAGVGFFWWGWWRATMDEPGQDQPTQ